MPEFKSSLGSKSFEGQQLREFDIPDEDGSQNYSSPPPSRSRSYDTSSDMNSIRNLQNKMEQQEQSQDEIEREIRQARESKRSGKERLNDGARRRIEMLIGMTRTAREVDLEGNVYILQTLRSKEMREAIMIAAEYDGTVQSPFEIRRQLLARSLVQVAGVEAAQFVGSNALEARLALVDDLPEELLNRLFDEYQKMINEARDKFSLKDAADAQEVIEDLKK
jgi:hypothetical protein